MPQFLTTAGTSHIIEDIIIKAKSELVLITPYLKLSRILFERLTDANHRGVRIQLVYGKSELQPSERHQLNALTNIELLFLGNLHAKCYFNESTLIVSSMNLYEFSEKNNREMGILLTKRDDEACFSDALAEAQSIINAARGGVRTGTPVFVARPTTPSPSTPSSAKEDREYDEELMTQKLFDALKKTEPNREFTIETKPSSENDKYYHTIRAQDYPRKGLSFNFTWSFRFDFSSDKDFDKIKATQQNNIERKLAGNYRCYWNRNTIQVYAASKYERTDEDATAEYFLKAIMFVAEALA